MKSLSYIGLLLLIWMWMACTDNPGSLCATQADQDRGHIVETLEIDCFRTVGTETVIRDQAAYETVLSECGIQGPEVDFTQHSLLALTTGASGCERYYKRCVSIHEDEKRYTFSVSISECGGCEPWAVVTHWAVVPRLPVDYTVRFETES